jgi:hypothetical protein
MMTAHATMERVFDTTRFAPTPQAREELLELLIDHYNDRSSAYLVAHEICDLLGVDRKEFSYPLELVLRPEYDR